METPFETVIVEQCPHYRAALKNFVNSIKNCYCVRDYASGEMLLSDPNFRCPDILIIDLILPGMSGVDLLKRLRQGWQHCRILVLTASEQEENVFAALNAGADGYLTKNTRLEALPSSIKGMRSNEFPLSRNIAMMISRAFRENENRSRIEKNLTFRENDVLNLVRLGYSNKEVAAKLSISAETVKTHLRNIYEKLKVSGRVEAAMKPRIYTS